jgi:hypothetical protein
MSHGGSLLLVICDISLRDLAAISHKKEDAAPRSTPAIIMSCTSRCSVDHLWNSLSAVAASHLELSLAAATKLNFAVTKLRTQSQFQQSLRVAGLKSRFRCEVN